MGRNSILLAGIAGLLGAVILFIFVNNRGEDTDAEAPDIETLLVNQISGWESEDLPVGETEEVKRKMGELLNYDAAIHRVYKKGHVQIYAYISYWKPGRAHFRNVYGHTPDVCWPLAGWEPTVRNPNYMLQVGADPVLKFKTAQYREFTLNNDRLRVLFWQLLDGEPFTYGNYGLAPLSSVFTDVFTVGFYQKPEQWFIRISANVDFENLERDKGFRELMESIAQFDLLSE